MDAHDDESALKMLSFPRGTNPFLDRERCLLCNCERTDPPEAEALKSGKLFFLNQLITIATCTLDSLLKICVVRKIFKNSVGHPCC